MKKAGLLFIFVFVFVLLQNSVMAQDKNLDDFYINRLQSRLEKNWIISKQCNYKYTNVLFTIDNDGNIIKSEIIKSSNDDKYDNKALMSLNKAVPFEKFTDINGKNSRTYKAYFNGDSITVSNVEDVVAQKEIDDIVFANYIDTVQNKINSNWTPTSFRSKRDAMALLKIEKDGTVKDVVIQKSGQKKKFDQEIVDAINSSVPFYVLPAELNAEYKNIQLEFVYDKAERKYKNGKKNEKYVAGNKHYILPHFPVQAGYEEYSSQVEDIITERLAKMHQTKYFCKKDIMVKINIDKNGKVKYVRIVSSKAKNNFIKKEFDRKITAAMNSIAFPSFPDSLNKDEITLNYRILTQRNRFFTDFLCYVGNIFRTGLTSFCVQGADSTDDL